ncbi:MAG: hypothetical protein EOP51_06345 [Sphingobacteriales bacterium]|nr:MAG: hypothetical protein EOP51_06345 [Sphingobacteriales bacterium]
MKKILLSCSMLAILATACKKDDTTPANTNTNTNTNTSTTTNNVAGDWTATVYDNGAVTAPEAATYKATATSTTAGTAHFDITFDGTKHDTEDVTYTLSSGNTKVDFTKTGGNLTTLSGGKTWTINKLDATSFELTSGYGMIVKFKK